MRITSRRRRPWIMLSLFAFALLLSAAGIVPVRRLISARMDDLRRYLAEKVERDYGLSLSYESLSPSILRSLEMRGLEVKSSLTDRVVLRARRVTIHYRISEFLSGRLDRSLREIRLYGMEMDLDSERDAALIGMVRGIAEGSGKAGSPAQEPAPLKVRCRDLSAALGLPQGRLGLEKASADLVLGAQGLEARITASASFDARPESGIPDFTLALQAEGNADLLSGNARMTASLSGATDRFSLKRQKYLVELRSGVLEARKVPDRSPIDASAVLDLKTQSYSVALDLEGYRPSEIVSLSGPYAQIDPWLGCGLSGTIRMRGGLGEALTSEYSVKAIVAVPDRLLKNGGRIGLDATGDLSRVEIRDFTASSEAGDIDFRGNVDLSTMTPSGTLGIRYMNEGMEASGIFSIRPEAGGVSVVSEDAMVTGKKLLSFSLDTHPTDSGFDFEMIGYLEGKDGEGGPESMEAFFQEAMTDIQAPRVEATGSVNLGGNPFAELSLYLSRIPSSFMYKLASGFTPLPSGGFEDFASDFTINAEAFLSTDFRKYSYNIPQIVLSYDEREGNYGVLSVSGGSTSFEASKIAFFWDGLEVSGNLGAELPADGSIAFASDFKVGKVPYRLSGSYDSSRVFSLRGDYGFALDGSFDGSDAYFSLGMRDMPLPLASFTPRLSLDAFGRFRDLGDWEVDIDSSSFEQTGGFLPSYARIGFDGRFDESGGTLRSISLQDSFSELEGSATVAYALEGDPYVDVDIGLSSSGEESYRAAFSLKPDRISGRATVAAAPVSRFVPKSPGGFLSVEAEAGGSLDDPIVDFSGSLSQAMFGANPLNAKAKGRYASRRIEIEDFSCGYFIFNLSGGNASYGLEDSLLGFQADCAVAISPGSVLTSTVDGKGRIMEKGAVAPSVKGNFTDIEIGSIRVDSWPYSFESRDGTASLDVGRDKYLYATIAADGTFALQMDSPLALRGFADGRIAEGKIDADVRNLTVDFPVIWGILGIKDLSFPSGSINADLKVTGNLADPDFAGSGRAEGFTCLVPGYLRDPIGPANASFKVDSKDILVDSFRAPAKDGKGLVDVDLSIQFDGWIPSIINLRARTVKGSPVRALAKISGFDVSGNADADLSMAVSAQDLSLSGSVFMQDTTIVMNPLPAAELPDTGEMDVRVKMQLGFGRKVELLWPLKNLPILRTYLEPSSSLSVGYDSSSASYSLKGNAKIRGGEVFYLKRNFYLKEGSIVFNENQSFFDPILNLRAEMRDQDRAGNILIMMKVENSRLSQFKPKLESIPARSEGEILAMFGAPAVNEDQGDSAALDWAIDSTSDVLAQFYGVRLFENTVRDTFGLDMFSVRTQVLQKLLLGTVDNTPSLGEYFDNTTLMAGKYIGSDLFLQTMVRAQMSEQVNSGGNLELDSEFSMEWNTPYFKLLWNLQPKHWEDLLVTDQSLGIFWSFSY